jgi:alpha-mannosidase
MRFEMRPAAFAVPKYKAKSSSFSLLNINSDQVNIQAVKMAENGSGVIVRLQELNGQKCSGVKLTTVLPIKTAELTDGIERPLNIKLASNKNVLSLDFTPYELKTVLLKMPGKEPMPKLTQAIDLKYDADIFSYNDFREDGYSEDAFEKARPRNEGHRGSMDGKGGTYPAEMIGDSVVSGNVVFKIGSRKITEYNAVACLGQSIAIPEGTKVLHIIAAADVDKDVIFKSGTKKYPLTIGGWTGNMGSWDKREFEGFVAELSYSMRNNLKSIQPAFIRNHRIAWTASHHHLPASDALYQYSYLFAYRLEIPEGSTSVTLPNSRFVRIVAMSVGDEGKAEALQSPFEDLHR